MLIINGIGCYDCYPYCGSGDTIDDENKHWGDRRGKTWGWQKRELPPAGNGFPSPTGKCESCNGTGIPPIPLKELFDD
jgi:hypothetical protein